MARKILILGASYGSLLGTKLLMAGQDVTLVCRETTAALINAEGTELRIRLRGEDTLRPIRSRDLPGTLDALPPGAVEPGGYDMVALAMSEPQYGSDEVRALMARIAAARVPCLSIMNMPPLPYLERFEGLDTAPLRQSYTCPEVWEGFEPGLMSLCSPDPQTFRLPGEKPNVLQVGLATNFKAAAFADPAHTAMLREFETAIAAVRLEGRDVPVKLRVFDSIHVPVAKWAMLLTGNYRCITDVGERAIRDAVHGEVHRSERIYMHVAELTRRLGAGPDDTVPFEKYAAAAEGLVKPSSVARAIAAGAQQIERVDRLVKLIGDQLGLASPLVDDIVATVDRRLELNHRAAA